MATVIVTDGKYRSAVAAVRSFGAAGNTVIVIQSGAERTPAAVSKYAHASVTLDLSTKASEYSEALFAAIEAIAADSGERPCVFPIGADTINVMSRSAEHFSEICDFLLPSPEALDAANDKARVAKTAEKLGIPTPPEYDCNGGALPPEYPVIIKPRCGEKFGLSAADRYISAENDTEFKTAYERMASYDPSPVVQKRISGDGVGISLVTDRTGATASFICHKRIREYPISGGPSSCCESIYDEKKLRQAERLLSELGYQGIAMVEFKGEYLLEINPRIWGSYPLTNVCGSDFAESYLRASQSNASGTAASADAGADKRGDIAAESSHDKTTSPCASDDGNAQSRASDDGSTTSSASASETTAPKSGASGEGAAALDEQYGSAASSEAAISERGDSAAVPAPQPSYALGRRMNYIFSDTAAMLSHMRRGNIRRALGALADILDPRVKEGLFSLKDPKPFLAYLKSKLSR